MSRRRPGERPRPAWYVEPARDVALAVAGFFLFVGLGAALVEHRLAAHHHFGDAHRVHHHFHLGPHQHDEGTGGPVSSGSGAPGESDGDRGGFAEQVAMVSLAVTPPVSIDVTPSVSPADPRLAELASPRDRVLGFWSRGPPLLSRSR